MTKEGKTTRGEKAAKQPCQGSLADIATFPLFSQTANPEGRIAGWMSLLLPQPCTIPAFAGAHLLAEGDALLAALAPRQRVQGVTLAAVTASRCCCSPAVVLFPLEALSPRW